MNDIEEKLARRALDLADQCVLCGMCSSHCPTYGLAQDENESPRGRISLIQQLARGNLLENERLREHLDHCLGCLNCASRCPSGVNYAELYDIGRFLAGRPSKHKDGLAGRIESRDPALRRVLSLADKGRGLINALALPLGEHHRLKQLWQRLPERFPQTSFKTRYPVENARAQVGLFTGCAGELFDGDALLATIELLNRLGYEVVVPAKQACCGAMALHDGRPQQANELAGQNAAAFTGCDQIIYISSGCGATLEDYGHSLLTDGAALAGRATSLWRFLDAHFDGEAPTLRLIEKKLAMHLSCSLRNRTGDSDSFIRLVQHVCHEAPLLVQTEGCCGAGGTQALTYPDMADAIRQPTLDALEGYGAELVISANLGCAMHLNAGLRQRQMACKTISLPRLLLEQLMPAKGAKNGTSPVTT